MCYFYVVCLLWWWLSTSCKLQSISLHRIGCDYCSKVGDQFDFTFFRVMNNFNRWSKSLSYLKIWIWWPMIIYQLNCMACKAILCWCLSFATTCETADQLILLNSYYTRFYGRVASPNEDDLVLKSPRALIQGPASGCWSSPVVCLKSK